MHSVKTIGKYLVAIVLTGVLLTGCTSIFDKESRAGVQIGTGQIDSVVFINGQYLDRTPLTRKNLKPGEYVIEIKPTDENLVPYETSITLRQDLLSVITWKPAATPEQSGGGLRNGTTLNKRCNRNSFSTVPDGAIIQLKDKSKEIAPYTFKDVPQVRLNTLSTYPHEQQQHTINVVPGYRMLVSIKLAKQNAIILQPTNEWIT